eukprot:scaffold8286_cov70-Skeletonema_dohrnii-CCMP3373.AAC.1
MAAGDHVDFRWDLGGYFVSKGRHLGECLFACLLGLDGYVMRAARGCCFGQNRRSAAARPKTEISI